MTDEFEQSKHFKLCQKEIEFTSEQVLIRQAAYHHALSVIRAIFRDEYNKKVDELLDQSENQSEVKFMFQREKRAFPDPINEAIW